MNDYTHTQPGTLIRILLGIFIIVMGGIAASGFVSGDGQVMFVGIGISGVIASVLALFHSLTVHVASNTIFIQFGIGVVQTRISIDEIRSAEPIKTHWYNGWGIRWIRGGWLYNVSGFDAVEVSMKNGRRYQIGTDEPEELHAAIESKIQAER